MVAPLAVAGVAGASNIIGDILNAKAGKVPNKFQENLEQMLGQRGLDIQSASVGDQIRRQLESMPERDRALYMLQARLGNQPSRFSPSGVFAQSGQTPNAGGIDFSAMQDAAKAYTPGAGGTRPDIASLMMSRLGYMPQGGGTGNPWQQSLNQSYGLNSPANWANEAISTNTGNYQFTGPQTMGSTANQPGQAVPMSQAGQAGSPFTPPQAPKPPQAQRPPNMYQQPNMNQPTGFGSLQQGRPNSNPMN